ncbi:MAG: M81 family metallopeptidase [Lachnospiraceae bacterium]|nr:M81 family metallopeptidase [Lachnospiraceae bacterium]
MKKLLIAAFKHETDSFCPARADTEAFRKRGFYLGEEVLDAYRGVKNEPGAFIDVFEERKDVTLLPVLALNAIPSGPVTGEVYEFAAQELLRAVREEKPDGILLSLHGAMVADGHDDGEGDLLEKIRAVTGKNVPLVVSLDLHANITAKMAANADALIPYEKYPHTDMYETGLCAAHIMEGLLFEQFEVNTGYCRIPYLNPMFPSDFPEIRQFHELCKSYEKDPDVLSCRLAHGFYPSDIAEMGMSVVTVAKKPYPAQKTAEEAGKVIWEHRNELRRQFTPLDEALEMVDEKTEEGSGPLVIADASDNPGGGGLCDTTHILRAVLEKGIRGIAFGMFCDPESVRKCEEAGIGNSVDLMLGGMSDPAFSGGPLAVRAYVKVLTDGLYRNQDEMSKGVLNNLGHTAVAEIAGNTVIISSNRIQPYDAELFRHCGIMPERQKAIVVKSAVHFRNSYGKFARKMVDVSLPGYVVPVPDGLPFRKWKAEYGNMGI